MDDLYSLSDTIILRKIGSHLKSVRLKQNITQMDLAKSMDVSVSSLKNLENGNNCSLELFLRVIRTLGELDILTPLMEENKLSPSEYYEMEHSRAKYRRKRATGTRKKKEVQNND